MANEEDKPAQSNLPEQPLGYVDYSGLFEEPGSFANMFIPYASETAARADVAAGKIAGYYVIPEEYLATGQVAVCGSNQRDGKRFRLV